MPSAIDQRLAAPFEREVQDREGEAEPGDLVPVARLDRPDRFPYVKNREGTDPVNLYGGIFRDASHLKPNPLMHYGMNYDLQEVVQTALASSAETMLYGEKGANGDGGGRFTAIMNWEWLWTDTAFKNGACGTGTNLEGARPGRSRHSNTMLPLPLLTADKVVYVTPNGDDAAPGTLARPLATPARAREPATWRAACPRTARSAWSCAAGPTA